MHLSALLQERSARAPSPVQVGRFAKSGLRVRTQATLDRREQFAIARALAAPGVEFIDANSGVPVFGLCRPKGRPCALSSQLLVVDAWVALGLAASRRKLRYCTHEQRSLALGGVMNPTPVRQIITFSIAVIAAGGVALGVGLPFVRQSATHDIPRQTTAPTQSNIPSITTAHVAAAPAVFPTKPRDRRSAPSFDVIRVEPDGNAVIAGRAVPGVRVELLRGNEVLGRVVADQNGEFVLIPPQLPSGEYRIVLRAKLFDGSEATSERSAAVVVEPRSAAQLANVPKRPDEAVGAHQPLAALRPAQSIVLETVAMGKDGKVTVRGQATAGAVIKLYLNDSFVTSVTPGADQTFSVTINDGVRPGHYRVRLEKVDPKSATIVARAERQFEILESEAVGLASLGTNEKVDQRQLASVSSPVGGRSPSNNVIVPKIITATVIRGDSLWRISQHSYGAGDLYQLIVRANRGKIRNPDLIYPKQILVLPPR